MVSESTNSFLFQAGCDRRINNFSGDIKDSVAYAHLLAQIAPKDAGVNKLALQQHDLTQRAEGTLEQADKMGCRLILDIVNVIGGSNLFVLFFFREFVTASDVVNGVEKLNLAFVANLFNRYPGLDEPEAGEIEQIVETREEKSKFTSGFVTGNYFV